MQRCLFVCLLLSTGHAHDSDQAPNVTYRTGKRSLCDNMFNALGHLDNGSASGPSPITQYVSSVTNILENWAADTCPTDRTAIGMGLLRLFSLKSVI